MKTTPEEREQMRARPFSVSTERWLALLDDFAEMQPAHRRAEEQGKTPPGLDVGWRRLHDGSQHYYVCRAPVEEGEFSTFDTANAHAWNVYREEQSR